MPEQTVNQRFGILLDLKKIPPSVFADAGNLDRSTVSNIQKGKTKLPKADFFIALARQFPEWVLWIITGEEKYYPADEEMPMMAREPEPPPYGQPNEVKALLETVRQLSASLENISKLVNDVPALREEVERLKKELEQVKQRK